MDDLSVCDHCHYRTDYEYVNDKFKLNRKIYDLSCTYDGYDIASLKFKEFIERENIAGVDFIELKNEPQYFVMFVRNVVRFDPEKRESRTENYCDKCGNYESFVGTTPAFLAEDPKSELCRTDIMFGSGNDKSPLLIASEKFKSLVEREKFKGIFFEQSKT